MVLAEWRRAWQALHVAELLSSAGYHEDAISRSYYATLHAAKAALYGHDIATTSHAAVKRMFGRHLIHTSAIAPVWSSNLGESLDDRLAADYDAQMTFSSPEVQQECQRTREFLDRIRRYLLIQGFAENELGTGASPS